MNRVFEYWTIFLIVLGLFKYGQCDIKCYSCSSQEEPRCLNPKDNLSTKKCDAEAMMEMKKFAENVDPRYGKRFDVVLHTIDSLLPLRCMKQVTVVHGKEYVIRGCQLDSGHPDICKVVTDDSKQLYIGNVTHCSLCNTDGCNFTSTLGSFKIVTILAITLVQKLFFF